MRQELSPQRTKSDEASEWLDYESIRSMAFAILLPLGLPFEDCEDLAQEALIAGLQRRDRIHHPIRWLAVKLRRDAWRLVAKNRRCLVLPPDELVALLDRHVNVHPQLPRVEANRLLARLPPSKARLLTLLYCKGLSELETALVLGLSPSSIKKLRSRALAFTRRLAAP